MNSERHEEIRKRLAGMPAPQPPPDLAQKIKAEIPKDLSARVAAAPDRRKDRSAMWRMAASILMLFGFAFIATKTYVESRVAEKVAVSAAPEPMVAPEVSRSVSSDRVAAAEKSVLEEQRREALLDLASELPPPPAPPPPPQASASSPRRNASYRDEEQRRQATTDDSFAFDAVQETVIAGEATGASPTEAEEVSVTASAPRVETAQASTSRPDSAAAAAPAAPAPAAAPQEGVAFSRAKAVRKRDEPKLLQKSSPRLAEKKEADSTGQMVFEVDVDRRGRVTEVRTITTFNREISEAYAKAIRDWKFAPAEEDGRAVESTTRVTIEHPEPK
jgi:hypothetical protein